ncbi:sec-independent protein translocase protein TatA [Streptoalloteichus tenebrarius]|uniref:Sec-independent protein translocase protein TatA n=1 Tax=Streptoalloteichus tenebrarius (strain ATCC 17920 / DSM 40477 / JCM 4838 / CBS 697.72 / NBRC 16177 / NCIMB 11028 / NRRL B-12390 / A12253. 1 / ISP 5477) TaxID=1933 RepID=A0ABT1HZ26_STRSD|nr:Sec-independent protein translocase subunit TatA [Streptoalloteichus tenebrarius]MCP2260789.1 sec-independent protein translocase protein TatA [Streptoalloteichus tenebrarius]BFF03395.1 hypothetical protein GCM10020241_50700 [Streptoalloteichus tenebrarius]
MGGLSPWHWLVVVLVFAMLFGAKRLPDAARSVGRSLRIFRAEMGTAGQSGEHAAAYDGAAGAKPEAAGDRGLPASGPDPVSSVDRRAEGARPPAAGPAGR